jgi:hypothetical protein
MMQHFKGINKAKINLLLFPQSLINKFTERCKTLILLLIRTIKMINQSLGIKFQDNIEQILKMMMMLVGV